MSKRPLFLERRMYRRRRLADAARALPVLGAVLLCLPLLWPAHAATARVMLYVFGLWCLLAIISGVISFFLHEDDRPGEG